MKRMIALIICLITGVGFADEPAAPTTGNVDHLREVIARQNEEIARLRAEIESLRRQLPPATQPAGAETAAAPVPDRPDRVVAFVCDASGSMIRQWRGLRVEIERAINDLDDRQEMIVVVARGSSPAAFRDQPVGASRANRVRAGQFLGTIKPNGRADLAAAVIEALKREPDVIWIATDGRFDHHEGFLAEIRSLLDGKSTRINTVLSFTGSAENQRMLWRLANDNGGICIAANGAIVVAPPDGAPAPTSVFNEAD